MIWENTITLQLGALLLIDSHFHKQINAWTWNIDFSQINFINIPVFYLKASANKQNPLQNTKQFVATRQILQQCYSDINTEVLLGHFCYNQ